MMDILHTAASCFVQKPNVQFNIAERNTVVPDLEPAPAQTDTRKAGTGVNNVQSVHVIPRECHFLLPRHRLPLKYEIEKRLPHVYWVK